MFSQLLFCGFFAIATAQLSKHQHLSNGSESTKQNRHLPTSSCSKLQYSIQKSILQNDYNLQNLKFQKRLRNHPQYIVTIANIKSIHDPLIELRCPINNDKLEIYFHESRFAAESVRLFDINSIFPIHQGQLNVRIKLDPLIILLETGTTDLSSGVRDIFYEKAGSLDNVSAKEHREEIMSDPLELEIEDIFVQRIKPQVAKQILFIVGNSTKDFFEQGNVVRF